MSQASASVAIAADARQPPSVHQGVIAGQGAHTARSIAEGPMDAATAMAIRGRSTSPGQYSSHGYGVRSVGGSHGVSPRTPRQAQGTSDIRFTTAVAELHRQAAAERRAVDRQIHQLRDQLLSAEPGAKRERWADLHGSVKGLMEEVAALGKQIENLDNKFSLKVGNCEELTRQKARELEQSLYAYDHKAQLAASTAEEVLKRQSAKVKKLSDAQKEHTQRIDSLEDELHRLSVGPGLDVAEVAQSLRPQMDGLERRLAGIEEELQGVTSLPSHSIDAGKLLDEHTSALAQLTLRINKQEGRIATATEGVTERLEKMVTPHHQNMREWLNELTKQDRELEAKLEHMALRVKLAAEETDEKIRDATTELRQQVETTFVVQDQALRRFESNLGPSLPSHSTSEEDVFRLSNRAAAIEQRLEALEQEWQSTGKVERQEVMRIEAELGGSLRRVSQKLTTCEMTTKAVQEKVDAVQRGLGETNTSAASDATRTPHAALEQQVRELTSRLSQLQDGELKHKFAEVSSRIKFVADTSEETVSELRRQVEKASVDQKEAIRRLQASLSGSTASDKDSVSQEELSRLSKRAVALDQRLTDLEDKWDSNDKVAELTSRLAQLEDGDSKSKFAEVSSQIKLVADANKEAMVALRREVEEASVAQEEEIHRLQDSLSAGTVGKDRVSQEEFSRLSSRAAALDERLADLEGKSDSNDKAIHRLEDSLSPSIVTEDGVSKEEFSRLSSRAAALDERLAGLEGKSDSDDKVAELTSRLAQLEDGELKSKFAEVSSEIKLVADASKGSVSALREEVAELTSRFAQLEDGELKSKFAEVSSEIKLVADASKGSVSALREEVEEASVAQKEALHRLEESLSVGTSGKDSVSQEEFSRLSSRAVAMDQRLAGLEDKWDSIDKAPQRHESSIAADSGDKHVSLEDFSRLSGRAASVEQRLESLEEQQDSSEKVADILTRLKQLEESQATMRDSAQSRSAGAASEPSEQSAQGKAVASANDGADAVAPANAQSHSELQAAKLDPELRSRLEEVLGRLDQKELEAMEVVKKVDSCAAAVMERFEQLKLEVPRREQHNNGKGEGDNDLLAYGRTGSNEGCDLDMLREVKFLKSKYEELVRRASPDGGIVERISMILGRISESERAMSALHSKVERALGNPKLSARKATAEANSTSGDQEASGEAKASLEDKLEKLENEMEAELEALAAHQKELGQRASMEERLEDLHRRLTQQSKEMSDERETLFRMLGTAISSGASSDTAELPISNDDVAPTHLEKKVNGLAELVAAELQELLEHQNVLKSEAAKYQRLSSASREVVSRNDPTSSSGIKDPSVWPVSDETQRRRWVDSAVAGLTGS